MHIPRDARKDHPTRGRPVRRGLAQFCHDSFVNNCSRTSNKASWKDILIYKSKDVPWKVKYQRLVDHVYAVFACGSENWSWTIQTSERIKGWETKTMLRLFRSKRHKEETWVAIWPGRYGYRWACPSCMKELQKVCGEPWDGYETKKSNAVIDTVGKICRWRSTRWWDSLQTDGMDSDDENHTRWMHKRG